ncbi:hypothetical protein FSP39_015741 [Pinctada imbricata]|uniref:Potassium channel domain-containing protein n=1 Tax=Pinctada imbricata TaxID=66713 RepID=A0AA88Y561_PINIB|nr:hypothetical protein FSP39_015741 [Pinctada imbricata]
MGSGGKKQNGLCKSVMQFLFSNVGICVIVVLYCVAGGFIFQHLEKNNEKEICYDTRDEYIPMENKTLDQMYNVIRESMGNSDLSVLMIELRTILETFRDNSIAIGYEGDICGDYGKEGGPIYKWSWFGATYFSVTVISTIGYGHIAPKTFWGRLVCIAYAVLGIPLMLLCLANIGDVLADVFRFIYSKICCCGCCRKKEKNKVVQIKPSAKEPEPGWKDDKPRPIPSGEYGSKVPPKINAPADETARPIKVPVDMKQFKTQQELAQRSKQVRGEPMLIDDDSDDEDDEFDEKKVTVPLTVTMLVIAGYIFGGAMLFGLWEGWDTLQSAYFCFITLSTIGFGDVTPGTDFENPMQNVQMILGSIYVLFGMAILSMCFTLMQDEIIAKCKWVGTKLGIIDEE